MRKLEIGNAFHSRVAPERSAGTAAAPQTRLADFAAALLCSDAGVPSGLVGPDGRPSQRRFNIYRNNVVAGLVSTLTAAYPAVSRIVGEEFFVAMARAYALKEPPDRPMMSEYGAGFADFIAGFEPAAVLPYLADVARIERAWVEAYHSAEAPPVDPVRLFEFAPEDRPHLRLLLHPSLRLVRSAFPALTIWQMNTKGGEPAPVDLASSSEDVLIVRPYAQVELRCLQPGGFAFVDAIDGGLSVLVSAERASSLDAEFDLSVNLSGLIEMDAIVGFIEAVSTS
jgi:putative DNA-binding protein